MIELILSVQFDILLALSGKRLSRSLQLSLNCRDLVLMCGIYLLNALLICGFCLCKLLLCCYLLLLLLLFKRFCCHLKDACVLELSALHQGLKCLKSVTVTNCHRLEFLNLNRQLIDNTPGNDLLTRKPLASL